MTEASEEISTPIEPTVEKKPVEEKHEKKSSHIPDALLLGMIPFLAYGLLYGYESNLLDYFGVPSRFVNYDIGELESVRNCV